MRTSVARLSRLAAVLAVAAGVASAEEIVVSNYGVSANGMPYAVAMEKGYFKDEGLNVTGIITSAGGGTTLRNMLAGNAPYAEVNPVVVVSAVLQGADLRIISDNVLTVAEFVWAVKPDSPIKSVKDFKGKKIGYTNPRSTSQALANLLLQGVGLKPARTSSWSRPAASARASRRSTSGSSTSRRSPSRCGRSSRPSTAPSSSRASRCRRSTTSSASRPPRRPTKNAQVHQRRDPRAPQGGALHEGEPGRGRRHRREGRTTSSRDVARAAVRNLTTSTTAGVPYWGEGQIHLAGLKRMIEAQKAVGAITGDVDYDKISTRASCPTTRRR